MGRVWAGIVCVCLCTSAAAFGQDRRHTPPPEDDHAIVFEIGAVGEWEPDEGVVHKGATFAFEVTPIERWLELEIGATAVPSDGGVEMPFDVLFKKPWRLSRQFEFMAGIGPELVHQSGPNRRTFWGIEAIVDFMFWPTKNVGWYVEPGYDITFQKGTVHRGVGVAAGLLVGK